MHLVKRPPYQETLTSRVVKGGGWIFALRFIGRALGLVRTVVLARLLSPQDFGVLGVALLSIAVLETFSQTGFHAALIQKKDDIDSYLDSAWTAGAVRGLLLFFVLFVSAPAIGGFFNSPQAVSAIRIISISTILSGFRSIKLVMLRRELAFGKQFIYDFSAMLVEIAVAIGLALVLRNFWALIWGGLAAHFTRLLVSYALCPYLPRIRFDSQRLGDMFRFGQWVFYSNALVFLTTQGDDMFVAKILGVTSLGIYQMAFLLSNLPATEITHVISTITFPAYAQLQDHMERLRKAYGKVLALTTLISIPFAGGIYVLAEAGVAVTIGEKWLPAVPVMQVLVFAGCIRSIAATTGPVFHAIGKPNIDTLWQSIRLAVLVIAIVPLTQLYGLTGTALSVLLSMAVSTVGFLSMLIRTIGWGYRRFLHTVVVPICSSALMVLAIKGWLMVSPVLNLPQLGMVIFWGVAVYLGSALLLDRTLNTGVFDVVKESVSALRKPLSDQVVPEVGNET